MKRTSIFIFIVIFAVSIFLFIVTFLFVYITTMNKKQVSQFPVSDKKEEKADNYPRILYINSYHHGYDWSDNIQKGLYDSLVSRYGQDMDFRVEYLDGKRFGLNSDSSYKQIINSLFYEKYHQLKFDMIFVTDLDAYNFFMENRDGLFRGAPMMFAGVETPGKLGPDIAGIASNTEIAENLELISAVYSGKINIWVITDTSSTGKNNRKTIENFIKGNDNKYKINFFDQGEGIEPGHLLEKISHLGRNDAIFLLDYYTSPSGEYIDIEDFFNHLTQVSEVPVFSHVDLYIRYGAIGGIVNSPYYQGQQLAGLATEVLDGKPIGSIGLQKEKTQKIFDYNKLREYKIPVSDLPEGSIIINKPVNLFKEYFPFLIVSSLFIISEIVLIIFLLYSLNNEKKLNIELQQSEYRFKTLFEQAPAAMTCYDQNGDVVYINRRSLELWGYTKEEQKNVLDFWNIIYKDPDYRDYVEKAWKKKIEDARKNNKIIDFQEFKGYTKSGKTLNLLVGGNILDKYTIVSFIDITDDKKMQQELKESNERYDRIIAATSDAIWEWDLENNTTFFSPRWYTMLGYEPGELPMNIETWKKLCHPEDLDETMDKIRKVIDSPIDINYEAEFRMETKNSQWKWILGRGKIVKRSKKGVPILFSGTNTDIGDWKKAEEERETLQNQLLQSQKIEAIGQLAGGVAHDFNNMLNVIAGHVDLINMGEQISGEIRDNLNEIRKAVNRSAELTRQLLTFARKQTVSPKIINLNLIITNILKMLRRLIGEEISLVWEKSEGLWNIFIDPLQIDQVLANLCLNARDAISGVGKIIIKAENAVIDTYYCSMHPECTPGDFVLITVTDNGLGMNKEVKEKIFEPFFTTKGVGKGTGLGLSTVYGIVKQNNGIINVYSEPSVGTTFKILFPRYLGEEDHADDKPTTVLSTAKGETIVFVEDEEAILGIGTKILKKLGYAVIPFSNPRQAYEYIEKYEGTVDLLVTDVIMPDMNGKQLSDSLLAIGKIGKTLFISGYTADIIANKGILGNNVNFLEKPFSLKEMSLKVRAALDGNKDNV